MRRQENDFIPLLEKQNTPCVSLFVPVRGDAPHENLVRIKNLLRQAGEKLANLTCETEAEEILRPSSDALQAAAYPAEGVRGAAAFASQGFHREFALPLDLPETAWLGRRFHIRPLLPWFAERDPFYILALSQKHVRLFEADRFEAHQVQAEGLPSDVAEMLRGPRPEKELQFHVAASGGDKRAIYHGGRYEPKDRLANYLREISASLFGSRAAGDAPLVVASVEYIASMYRAVSDYPHIVEGLVAGNPDLLSAQQLHARAWEIVEPHFARKRQRMMVKCGDLIGTTLATQDEREIASAAREGRIRTLFIASGVQRLDAGGEDILNQFAAETLLHGGVVHEVPQAEMPEQAEITAVFRY